MKLSRNQIVGVVIVAGLAALTALCAWQAAGEPKPKVWSARPWAIMGTDTELKVVATSRRRDVAGKALSDAEKALRHVEMLMSRHLAASELSRFNAAEAGEFVPLSAETLEVLRAALEAYRQTDGAFDVTCLPIIEVWKKAHQAGRAPAADKLAEARRRSTWADIELREGGVVKKKDTARVDLGGIAKGFGIDKAVEAMKKAGVAGGQVDVGGDIRSFGRPPGREHWPVHVQNPFGEGVLATLALRDAAVCTSGNYARYFVIEGRRYSHIVDPRDGPRAYMALPAGSTPASVTVIAPTATTADAWATALSVLGVEGLKKLPKGAGIEALIVTGGSDDYEFHMTEGFEKLRVPGPGPASAGPPAGADEGRGRSSDD